MDDKDNEFIEISKIICKLKEEYSRLMEEKGNDEGFYPIQIIVWTSYEGDGVAGKKLAEIDDRAI